MPKIGYTALFELAKPKLLKAAEIGALDNILCLCDYAGIAAPTYYDWQKKANLARKERKKKDKYLLLFDEMHRLSAKNAIKDYTSLNDSAEPYAKDVDGMEIRDDDGTKKINKALDPRLLIFKLKTGRYKEGFVENPTVNINENTNVEMDAKEAEEYRAKLKKYTTHYWA